MKQKTIKIANAPCSWGVLEFDLEGEVMQYDQVLNEMSDAGYSGTELGDWGFMPSEPHRLHKVLVSHNLELLAAFVPVALSSESAHQEGIEKALKVADLMYSAGYKNAFIVLADDNGTVEERTRHAGRISAGMGLSEEQWNTFALGTEKIAKAVKSAFGMGTVFHHHCAGYVETPEELEKLMKRTDPNLVGLCLDMGHYSFAGGDPLDALHQYYDRIWHIHFKDYDPLIGEKSRLHGWDYFESVSHGVFCELGKGMVDFKAIVSELQKRNYDGWIVVEQDVLPGMGDPKTYAKANIEYIKTLGI